VKLLLALDAIGRDNDHALDKASHHASRCRVQPIHHLGITWLFQSALNSAMHSKSYRIAWASSQYRRQEPPKEAPNTFRLPQRRRNSQRRVGHSTALHPNPYRVKRLASEAGD
jgi:hypothetical protein